MTFNLSLTDPQDAFENILGAGENWCYKLGLLLATYTPIFYLFVSLFELCRSYDFVALSIYDFIFGERATSYYLYFTRGLKAKLQSELSKVKYQKPKTK